MAVGTVVLTSHNNVGGVRSIVVTATASSTDASFPTATLFSLGLNDISGAFVGLATNPGSTAPTDNYDITLVDGDGLDRLNAVGMNRDTTTSERVAVTGVPYFTQGELGNLTLTIAGNAVNSAVVVITLYYSPTASASSGGSGGGGDATAANQVSIIAKQPALGTAGTASTDVITVQGIASGLPIASALKQTRISVTPTISAASIYASGDAVGGLLTFANAARVSGGTVTITAALIIDKDQELAPLELVLFDRTFTNTADNGVFAPSDADLANYIGVVKISDYANFSTNSVAVRECRLTATLNGTSLFGQLVVRGTPTYTATSDIIVIVQVVQD